MESGDSKLPVLLASGEQGASLAVSPLDSARQCTIVGVKSAVHSCSVITSTVSVHRFAVSAPTEQQLLAGVVPVGVVQGEHCLVCGEGANNSRVNTKYGNKMYIRHRTVQKRKGENFVLNKLLDIL